MPYAGSGWEPCAAASPCVGGSRALGARRRPAGSQMTSACNDAGSMPMLIVSPYDRPRLSSRDVRTHVRVWPVEGRVGSR
eukprot:1870146-Prymnesium_polylepis.1